jgi:hypothetical protein
MPIFNLEEFVDDVDEIENAGLLLHASNMMARSTIDNLRKLRRLGLLHDDAILALIGRAPVDPLNLYGAMKDMGVWAFQPRDFTVIQVLKKEGPEPVAAMRLDLLSDDLDFIVLRDGQLVLREHISSEELSEVTGERLQSWLAEKIKATIDEGTAAARALKSRRYQTG